MRALSLSQPWASLVADQKKRIETRSWSTAYRGPLAIHAAKSIDWDACAEFGYITAQVPRGVVVCTCQLVGCFRFTDRTIRMFVTEDEWKYGNFNLGRWGWQLREMKKLRKPVPAIGKLRLWEWDERTHRTQ